MKFQPTVGIRRAITFAVVLGLLFFITACRDQNQPEALEAKDVMAFDLADASSGRFDWPASRSTFAIRRPPVYSSLIGLRNEPLDELDQKEKTEPEPADDEQWHRFLRTIGTNPITPFQLKPIHLEIARLKVSDGPVSFAFSGDADELFIHDGKTVRCVALSDGWKSKIPLMKPPVGQSQQERWKLDLSKHDAGGGMHLAVTACGTQVERFFDVGLITDANQDEGSQEDNDDDAAADSKQPEPVPSQLVIIGSKFTLRVDPENGKPISKFTNPPGLVEYAVAAMDAGHVFATTETGDVYFNGHDSAAWIPVGDKVQPASEIESGQSIAVKWDGSALIGWVDAKPITIWTRDGVRTATSVGSQPISKSGVTSVWATNGRIWCDEHRLHFDEVDPEAGAAVSVNSIDRIIWRPVAMWPQRAGPYCPNPGHTTLGLRRLRDGRAMWCIWDMNSNRGGNSVATELLDDKTLAQSSLFNRQRPTIAVSTDASRIAYLDPAASEPTVQVVYRNPWERGDSNQVDVWCSYRLRGSDEDRRTLERVGERVRSLPVDLYWCLPPEELYLRFVHEPIIKIVSNWEQEFSSYQKQLHQCKEVREQGHQASTDLIKQLNQKYRDIASWDEDRYEQLIKKFDEGIDWYGSALEKVRRWRESRGTMPLAVEAEYAMKAAWRARGSGFASSVTRQGYETFALECQKAEQTCLEILQRPRPPMAAFLTLLDSAKGTGQTHQSVKSVVRRCNSLYPHCNSIHTNLAFWLLPRWGGQSGDSASYVDAAINNCNDDLQDKLFAHSHIQLAYSFSAEYNYFAAMGVDANRVWKGAMRVLDEEAMTNPYWIGQLMVIANLAGNQSVSDAAYGYYREHFAYPTGEVFKKAPSLFEACFDNRPRPR